MAFSAMLKTEGLDVSAALVMLVLAFGRQPLCYDDMFGRNVTGTKDWVRYTTVLDVTEDASFITIAIRMRGIGEVWISDITFEETQDKTTGKKWYEPMNLDFSE